MTTATDHTHADAGAYRLRFPLQPFPGESLRGFVVRSAAWNLLPSPQTIWQRLGVERAGELAIALERRIETAASYLRIPLLDLRRMLVIRSPENLDYFDYYGARLLGRHLDRERRRVAPASLRRSPHHRVSWTIGTLTYCPETWDTLIERCPKCRHALSWRSVKEVHLCEACDFDLSTGPSVKVPPACRPALQFVADLVSHDPQVRDAAAAILPSPFCRLPPGSIFDLILAFGLAARPDDERERRQRLGDGQPNYVDLLKGLACVCDYPGVLRSHVRAGDYSNARRSPFFTRVWQTTQSWQDAQLQDVLAELEKSLEPIVHGVARLRYIREANDQLTLTQAAAELQIEKASLRRLVDAGALPPSPERGVRRRIRWFSSDDLEALRRLLRRRISITDASRRFGLPHSGFEQLVSAGFLDLCPVPGVQEAFDGLQLDHASLKRLVACLTDRLAYPSVTDPARHTLSDVFTGVGGAEKPWAAVIGAILESEDQAAFAWDRTTRFSFKDLLVNADFGVRLVAGRSPELLAIPPRHATLGAPANLTRGEVETYLNCFPRDVHWLIAHGQLPSQGEGTRRFARTAVEDLGRRLISSREITWRWRISPTLRDSLPEAGIRRVLGPFWPRMEVTSYFQARFPLGGPV